MLPHSPFSSPPPTPRFVSGGSNNNNDPFAVFAPSMQQQQQQASHHLLQPPHSTPQQPLTPLFTPSPPFSPPPTAQHYLPTTTTTIPLSQPHEGFSFHQLQQNPRFGQQPFQQQLYPHSPLPSDSICQLPVVTKRRRAQESLNAIEEGSLLSNTLEIVFYSPSPM